MIDGSGNPSVITTSGGNIGINIAVPTAKHHVVSAVDDLYVGAFQSSASTGHSLGMLIDGGTNSSDYALRVRSKAGVDYFAVKGDGKAGFGTNVPGYPFDLKGPASTQVHIGDSTDNGMYLMGFGGDAYVNQGSVFSGSVWIAKNTTASMIEMASGVMSFYSKSGLTPGNSFSWPTAVLAITSSKVGVGVTPNYKLDIATSTANDRGINVSHTAATGVNYGGLFNVTGAATTNTGIYIEATGATNNKGLYIANPTLGTNNFAIFSSATAKSYFGGHVGIGSTDGTYALQITGLTGTGSTRLALIPATNDYALIQFSSTGGTSFLGQDNSTGAVMGAGNFAFMIHNAANSATAFSTNSVTRFIISAAGLMRFNAYGAGTLTTDASGNITATSDARLKDVHRPFWRGLEDLRKAGRPVIYSWKSQEGKEVDTSILYAGWTAQSLIEAIPEAVFEGKEGYTLWDRAILATHHNSILELEDRIKELENKLKGH